MRLHTACLFAISLAAAAPALARVDTTTTGTRAKQPVAVLSPVERGRLAQAFVRKWGAYVMRVYDVPVGVWAKRMVPTLSRVDAGNLRKAMGRETFEGALAELGGTGHRLSDQGVIERYARLPASATPRDVAAKLGDTTGDLTYTPVTPCRIADTRVAGGPIAAGGSRSFLAVSAANYTSQGGSATNCGLSGVVASAVAINVTAVTPAAAGYATVYPFGTAAPVTASVNYTAGAIVNNAIISRIPNPLQSFDFTVFTFAQSDYVMDIVGYFAPAQATPLDCVNTTVTTFTIPANSVNFYNNPTCPTGYTATTPYCWTAATGVYSQGSGFNANAAGNATFCSWQNTTASNQSVFGGNVCCRIPGR